MVDGEHWFEFHLAGEWRCTVTELRARMSNREFMQHLAFYKLQSERDARAAQRQKTLRG